MNGHLLQFAHDLEMVGEVGSEDVVLQDVEGSFELVVRKGGEYVAAATIENGHCLGEVVSLHHRAL